MKERLVLFLAEGGPAGRMKWAPGTWGSVVGLIWFALLGSVGNLWLFLVGSLAGVLVAVGVSGRAEKLLRQHDPPSVVIDEIVAVPLCFVAYLVSEQLRAGHLPDLSTFGGHPGWIRVLAVFILFRIFDITKPWPVRQTQKLPGGWGVTADDVAAACYVNLVQLPFLV